MRADLQNEVYGLLNPYFNSLVPMSNSALNRLDFDTLKGLYEFLLSECKCDGLEGRCRPDCPVKTSRHANLGRFPYKKEMNDYIARWGYAFEKPHAVPTSIFEAVANYLESK